MEGLGFGQTMAVGGELDSEFELYGFSRGPSRKSIALGVEVLSVEVPSELVDYNVDCRIEVEGAFACRAGPKRIVKQPDFD